MFESEGRVRLLDSKHRQRRKMIVALLFTILTCVTLMILIGVVVTNSRNETEREDLIAASVEAQYDVLPDGNVVFAKNGTIDRVLADWFEDNDGDPRAFEVGGTQFSGKEIAPRASTIAHLPNFVKMLKSYPKASVRIFGYTNPSGNAAADKLMATDRAKWLYDYLVEAGVKADRVSYLGRGGAEPVPKGRVLGSRGGNERIALLIDPK